MKFTKEQKEIILRLIYNEMNYYDESIKEVEDKPEDTLKYIDELNSISRKMKRYLSSEDVIKRKYNKVVEANIKLVDENRYLKVDIEKLNQDLINEKNAYNSMYNMYFKKVEEVEKLENIINILETDLYNDWLENRNSKYESFYYKAEEDREIYDKLQELKGSEKE